MFARKPVDSVLTLQDLSDMGPIEVAVDTEFKDAQTLTIQAATRLSPGVLAVQIYRMRSTPRLPRDLQLADFLPTEPEAYGRFFERVILRRMGKIRADLSPVQILTDLFDIKDVERLSRHQGRSRVAQAPNRTETKKGSPTVPKIRLIVIGHFLPADFGRMFESNFFEDLFQSQEEGKQALKLTNRKVIGFASRPCGQ